MARKRGWHFLNEDLQAHNGTEGPWSDGEVRELDVELAMCQRGYHASPRLIDALGYCFPAKPVLTRVELSGTIVDDTDKSVATRRRLLWHHSGT
jgi:hypothetical protein